jgi:hypothetical protein
MVNLNLFNPNFPFSFNVSREGSIRDRISKILDVLRTLLDQQLVRDLEEEIWRIY